MQVFIAILQPIEGPAVCQVSRYWASSFPCYFFRKTHCRTSVHCLLWAFATLLSRWVGKSFLESTALLFSSTRHLNPYRKSNRGHLILPFLQFVNLICRHQNGLHGAICWKDALSRWDVHIYRLSHLQLEALHAVQGQCRNSAPVQCSAVQCGLRFRLWRVTNLYVRPVIIFGQCSCRCSRGAAAAVLLAGKDIIINCMHKLTRVKMLCREIC